ncbi:MAG: hypothetical protein LBD52_07325, partial [Prevotellaceae bacterium]|nr:hypothetical protein [Prevotellaceae bacterium]
MRIKRITKAPSFQPECANRTERRKPPTTAPALCRGRRSVRDATFVEFVRIPDGMRGLISCIFLPDGNPYGIFSPDDIHGIFSFPPRKQHPVRDARPVEDARLVETAFPSRKRYPVGMRPCDIGINLVRIPDGMRGLISCIVLPGGNPAGIFSPDGIHGIFSFPPRKQHPVGMRPSDIGMNLVRRPDGMRGLISRIFLPDGNPYGIFSPDGIHGI